MIQMKQLLVIVLSVGVLAACSKGKSVSPRDSGYETPPDPGVSEKNIKVMSFNVHSCIPYGMDGATTANVPATATVIKNADPDVVLLQEVDVKTDRSGKVDQIAALSEYTGMKYYTFAKAISYQNGDFGVAVLSKYPIEYSKTHILPKIEVAGSYVEQRVLCETRITFPGSHTYTVAVTHLDLTEANRLEQVPVINEILSKAAHPVIFGGDFNAQPGTQTINMIDAAGFVRSCKQNCFSIPSNKPTSEIDFVTFRPSAKFTVVSNQVITGVTVSDHLPVISILEMK